MTLYEIIVRSARKALTLQDPNGAMPPGNNGSYGDPETPVRNTAHWAITYLKAFQINGSSEFEQAAKRCFDYLLTKEARPMNATFWHRSNPKKDFSNGLVGQAWTIEALLQLSKHFDQPEAITLAEEVFLLHPFDKRWGAWKRVNVDGSYRDFDGTFNHQLWFAASGALLVAETGNEDIRKSVTRFMDLLDVNMKLYGDGLIQHLAPFYLKKKTPVKALRQAIWKVRNGKHETYMRMKSAGYHGFNMYAFALIKTCLPDHKFWNSPGFRSTMQYLDSAKFRDEVAKSSYGYPYNPPGFEAAYALQELSDNDQEIAYWVTEQIKHCYDQEAELMIGGDTQDQNTAAARLYEATRLHDCELQS